MIAPCHGRYGAVCHSQHTVAHRLRGRCGAVCRSKHRGTPSFAGATAQHAAAFTVAGRLCFA
eukprot:4429589-Alexandrium_andersonii.AAC.1